MLFSKAQAQQGQSAQLLKCTDSGHRGISGECHRPLRGPVKSALPLLQAAVQSLNFN